MGVSRAGFYTWKNRDASDHRVYRDSIIAAVEQVHKKHATHGYRWVAAFIRINYPFSCSDSYAYKVFRFLGIKSETEHRVTVWHRVETSELIVIVIAVGKRETSRIYEMMATRVP